MNTVLDLRAIYGHFAGTPFIQPLTLTPVNRDDIAPFVVASFDIECSSSTGKFPDADVPDDVFRRQPQSSSN